MVDAEPTQSDDAPASAPAAPIFDWANVRGFQVLAATGADADATAADPGAHARELAKELGARAARFAQSVDDSIVLASDGLIRWLGDPMARLIAGDDLLSPKAVLLADEALPEEGRAAVQTRLDLWLSAHIGKVLGPLQALAEPGAVAEPVRALAGRIAQALGVLERERVRQQVKALDQSARSALRKLGVRFGSMYVFVPALLKPGARTLCSQLWGLRRGEAGAERLLAFAAAGRTSFAAEAPLAADTYRVAGFRLCGDRVVRIDIVERLNDLIRAAIPDHMRPGAGPASEAAGFVVTPQMTSLTGCAGEAFASILRSLGYESHRVKKSDFEAATRKPTAPTTPIQAPVVAAPSEGTSLSEADEGESPGLETSAETVHALDAPDDSPPSTEDGTSAREAIKPGQDLVEGAAPPPLELPSAAAAAEADAEPDTLGGASPPSPELTSAAASAEAEAEPDPLEAASTPSLELPSVAASAEAFAEPDILEAVSTPSPEEPVDAAEPSATEQSASADPLEAPAVEPPHEESTSVVDTSGAESLAVEEEWIEVWRPAPRRRPQPAPRPPPGPPSVEGAAERPPRHARDPRRRWPRDSTPRVETPPRDGVSAEALATVVPEAPGAAPASEGPREGSRHEGGGPHRQERGRRQNHRGPRPEEARASDAMRKDGPSTPAKKEHRAPPVDMDSPFAKLLALKPLLERRDKRT